MIIEVGIANPDQQGWKIPTTRLMDFGNNNRINYFYNSTGEKMLRAVSVAGATPIMTYYFGPFIHEGTRAGTSSLKYILTTEGRILNVGTDLAPIWKWEYDLKDHLGNVRVVVSPHATPGYATLLQENNYYPFGMRMSEICTNMHGICTNQYKYNGKELQTDFGLNWYDYGARFYDPALGRWHSVDPIADQFVSQSPYSYVGNNPIKRIDPDGNDAWDVVLGFVAAVVDNACGGFSNIRETAANYVTDAGDFNSGQNSGDAASIVIGGLEVGGGEALSAGGEATVAASIVAEMPSGGTSTVTLAGGAAAAAVGAGLATHGVVMAASGTTNLVTQKGRLPEGSGTRTKNRLPDSGDPNSMKTNEPGTTTKKYGSDGNVQKEYNKGHQGGKTPKNEKADHVHDYKPSSHPNGKPERQPGRPLKKNEMSKDKYKTQNGN